MKAKRFTEEQIIGVLRESEAGAKTKELCRRHGISDATFYNWTAKYADIQRLTPSNKRYERERQISSESNPDARAGRRPSDARARHDKAVARRPHCVF
jgi:putative transposase